MREEERESESERERERERERGYKACTDWIKLFQLIQSVSKFANSNFCFFTSFHSNQKKFQNLESKQNRNLLFKPFFKNRIRPKICFGSNSFRRNFRRELEIVSKIFLSDAKHNKMRFKAT